MTLPYERSMHHLCGLYRYCIQEKAQRLFTVSERLTLPPQNNIKTNCLLLLAPPNQAAQFTNHYFLLYFDLRKIGKNYDNPQLPQADRPLGFHDLRIYLLISFTYCRLRFVPPL